MLLLVFSTTLACSSDDPQDPETTTNEPIADLRITSFSENFRYDIKESPDFPDIDSSRQEHKGQLVDNKYKNIANNFYRNGTLVSQDFTQTYEYGNGPYVTRLTIAEDVFTNYFYDDDNRLIGVTRRNTSPGNLQYFRFIYNEQNIFVENVDQPYTVQDSRIRRRSIIEFDGKNNITKAGKDEDFDGIMDAEIILKYDDNENLLSITKPDGTSKSYSYASFLDTETFLLNNTHGAQNLKILQTENIVFVNFNNTNFSFPALNVFNNQNAAYTNNTNSNYYHSKIEDITTNEDRDSGFSIELEITFEFN